MTRITQWLQRRARTLLLTLVALVLVFWAAWSWVLFPDPATAGPGALMRWVALRDLQEQPVEFRRVLVARLEKEVPYEAQLSQYDPEQDIPEFLRQRISDNVVALMGPWFLNKADEYQAIPPHQRRAFLDDIIDRMEHLDALVPLCRDKCNGMGVVGLLQTYYRQVAYYKAHASDADRRRMQRLDNALRNRALARGAGAIGSEAARWLRGVFKIWSSPWSIELEPAD